LPILGKASVPQLTGAGPGGDTADAGRVGLSRRWIAVLSADEQRVWDDIERRYAAEAEEPDLASRPPRGRRRDGGGLDDLPATAVAGGWIAVMLVIFGVPVAGLAIGAATTLGWAAWRYWPQLSGAGAPQAGATGEELGGPGPAEGEPADQPWHRRLRRAPETG